MTHRVHISTVRKVSTYAAVLGVLRTRWPGHTAPLVPGTDTPHPEPGRRAPYEIRHEGRRATISCCTNTVLIETDDPGLVDPLRAAVHAVPDRTTSRPGSRRFRRVTVTELHPITQE